MYIDLETLEYPLTEYQVRERLSPATLANPLPDEHAQSLGYAVVQPTEPPELPNSWDSLQELAPKKVKGVWVQRWSIVTGEEPPTDWRLSPLAFLMRFDQERLAIRTAAKKDVQVEDFLDLAGRARYVDLSAPLVRQGVDYLVSLQLLTATRAAEILDTPPVPAER
ncbi:hypothetical protein [Pseudomonas mangiferae]|uniref:Uncharacterized protein n=1 Tax=Pseudomonas mangiferae TaxID=2593654 RepID=A0A553H0K4_9PSED|nr:hypothetical protein [Pseudomonas mangiferae]TRX75280.1 hypothetical protein FM069_09310 [Pseudomonas mangiferae]